MLEPPLEEVEAKREFFGAEGALEAGRRGTKVVMFRLATGDENDETFGAELRRS